MAAHGAPMTMYLTRPKRQVTKTSDQIARDLAAFEARGGVVQEIPMGVSGDRLVMPARRPGNRPGKRA